MFYAHFVLAKKGPLARIWLAAHWDKKLTKAQIFETNIEKSVEGILQPKVKMALRTSGHLLLGVVRIYSRKAKYLLADCNEAFVKIKMAFRPGMVDLPEESREAAVKAITLPEVFHDFDTAMPELNDVDIQAQFSLNQSRAEEITMREDFGNIPLVPGDEGFGDIGFGPEPPELLRDSSSIGHSLSNLILETDKHSDERHSSLSVVQKSLDEPIHEDGFGGSIGHSMMAGGLFEGDLFEDTPLPDFNNLENQDGIKQMKHTEHTETEHNDEIMDQFGGIPSLEAAGSLSGNSQPASPIGQLQTNKEPIHLLNASNATIVDHTTLIHNEDESFALAPIEASSLKGWPRTKRKRKLIVDEIKNISGDEMKSQLSDTSDIVTTLDLAPPTKRLMHWKETGGVEKLFALPGRTIPARLLIHSYQRHLTSRPADNEFFDHAEETVSEQLISEPLKIAQDETPELIRRISRKRKSPKPETMSTSIEGLSLELRHPSELILNETKESTHQIDLSFDQQIPSLLQPEHLAFLSRDTTTESHTTDLIKTNLDQSALTNMGYEPNQLQTSVHLQPQTPDVRDYEFPMSVGQQEEHQQQDETTEQYEERIMNKRAEYMQHLLHSRLNQLESVKFSRIIHNNNRKQVAQKFYTLLVLKKQQIIELDQQSSYDELFIKAGLKFGTCAA